MGAEAPRPEVSVVVVVHNDASRLPRAVRSVLDQSLRNVEVIIVDDASDDETPEVARALAEQPRVRFVGLTENSGAAGRPRNIGLQHVLAPYVLFLDSDDRLDRHALRNLLVAAEETGSDLVAGRVVRVHLDRGGERKPWFWWLYPKTVTYRTVDEQPNLLFDTNSTNKLYRVDFLERHQLRYPEGRFYEDLLFVTKAYVLAQGITLIPHLVYFWNVDKSAARLSVTNRRAEIKNLNDRISINRDIDAFLIEQGKTELKRFKDVKFVKVDLSLYLSDLPHRDNDFVRQVMTVARDYLESLPEDVLETAGRLRWIATFFIRHDDLPGVLSVVDYLNHGNKITTRLVRRGSRVYWCDRYLDTEEGRRILDVTGLGFQDIPPRRLHLDSRIDRFELKGKTLLLEGHTANQLNRIPPGPVEMALVFTARGSRRRTVVPLTVVGRDEDQVHWKASFDVTRTAQPRSYRERSFELRLRTRIGNQMNLSPITALDDTLAGRRLPMRPWFGSLAGDSLETHVSPFGNLGLRMVAVSPLAVRKERLLRALVALGLVRLLRAKVRTTIGRARKFVASERTKSRVYRSVLVRLPRRPRTIVFESHMGKAYSDNPRYIFEELRRRGRPFDYVWSHAGGAGQYPPDVRLVRRGSWRYLLALARAGYWVDNQGFPRMVTKPRKTVYLQTWHGSALKRMGVDTPAFRRQSTAAQQRHRDMVSRWDYFVARSEHDVQTLVRALEVSAEVLPYGYPRNDLLVTCREEEERARIRDELELPQDQKLVLYAPTFRESANGREKFSLRIDLDRFHEELPGHLLLVRTHYLDRLQLPAAAHVIARDVSHVPDITPLLVAADVLVTDYSSVMFDFAVTGRPMVFYTYDLDDYVNSQRGVYFDLAERAPGPLVADDVELIDRLRTVDTWSPDFVKRYDSFVREFCEYDQGDAARRIVDHVFGGGGRERR